MKRDRFWEGFIIGIIWLLFILYVLDTTIIIGK
jgi:hypothetical protein